MKLRLCLLMLFFCALAYAKEPLAISGDCGAVIATNTSGKTIVAFVVEVESSCGGPAKKRVSHDFFFKHGLTTRDAASLPVPKFTTGAYTAKSVFVQFDDGSTYGDNSTAATLFGERALVLEWLKLLNSQPDDASLSAAIDAEAKGLDAGHKGVQRSLQKLRGQFGLFSVRADVSERLKTAKTRMDSGKF